MLRIGEFARLSRVSIRMLRHYDEVGLLPPAHVDPETGYRYYRTSQLRTLNRIIVLRDLGFSIRDIARSVHGDGELDGRREQDLLAELEKATAQLTALRARQAVPDADVVIRTVPPERVATLTAPAGTDVEDLFNALESFVAEHQARADRPPMTLLEESSVTVAVPVRAAVPERRLTGPYDVRMRSLPATTMACSVHNGSYAGLADELQRMVEFLIRTGRRPGGPLREVYLRFGADASLRLPPTHLVDETDPGYVTELQVPCEA